MLLLLVTALAVAPDTVALTYSGVAGQLKVFGKGAKERIVPMGLNARRALLRYKEHARPQPALGQDHQRPKCGESDDGKLHA